MKAKNLDDDKNKSLIQDYNQNINVKNFLAQFSYQQIKYNNSKNNINDDLNNQNLVCNNNDNTNDDDDDIDLINAANELEQQYYSLKQKQLEIPKIKFFSRFKVARMPFVLDYQNGVSKEDIIKKYNISPSTYYKKVRQLIDKKHIKPSKKLLLQKQALSINKNIFKTYNKLSLHQQKLLIDDFKNGMKKKDLALKYNICTRTVYKILKNISKYRYHKLSLDQRKLLIIDYKNGIQRKDLAEKYNITTKTVYEILKKNC